MVGVNINDRYLPAILYHELITIFVRKIRRCRIALLDEKEQKSSTK